MYGPWTHWPSAQGGTAFAPTPYGPFPPQIDPRLMGRELGVDEPVDTDRNARSWNGPRGLNPIEGVAPAEFRGGFVPRPFPSPFAIDPIRASYPGAPFPFVPTDFAPQMFGDDYRVDARLILEEIRRCGRGLQSVSEDLDGPDTPAQYKAHLAATRFLFYTLGLLFSRGVFLPPDINPGDKADRSVTRGSSCKAAGQAIEKFVRQQLGGRSTGNEVGDLIAKLRDCWEQLTKL